MAVSNESMESLLKAMDIIASRKVEKVAYDSTIICTITDDSDRKNGCYTVTDGTIKFQAYSEVTNYKVDDQVRVSIPNGDYTQEKYIEGKYVSDNNTSPITYTSPLESVVDMATLAGAGTQVNISGNLIANYVDPANPVGIQLHSWQFNTGDKKSEFADLQENSIYDTIFLKADFRSLLSNRKMRSGTYGLRLDIRVRTNSENHPYITKSLYLDSSEMFGNPYAFTVFSTQEKKFDISTTGVIDSMTLYFYQNNDFTYFNGKENIPVPVEKTIKVINGVKTEVPTENLFVKNIYLGFGSDISAVTDNTVQLYSSDDMGFKHFTASDSTNQKTLGFLWYNKTEDNKYVGFSDGVVTRNEDDSIFDYDEITYLNDSEVDSRLMAQKGKTIATDTIGLDAAASIEEAEPILNQCSKLITSDLTNTFKSFKDRLRGLVELQEEIDDILTSTSGATENLPDMGEELDEYITKIVEYFTDQLAYAAALQRHQKDGDTDYEKMTPAELGYYWDSTNSQKDIKGILSRLETLIYNQENPVDRLAAFMPNIRDTIKTKYQGYQGIYDTYATRVDKIFTTLKENYEKLESLLAGKEKLISNYDIDYNFVEYVQPDLSHLNNRYCVYWYRFVKGYEDKDERFMGKEWQRFTPELQFDYNQSQTKHTLRKNAGLPQETYMDGATEYFVAKPSFNEGTFTLFLDPNKKEEKFVVVVFYNHEMFKSGELVFTNEDTFEDPYSVDKSDAIYIEHKNNSMESYQSLYGASNFLNNSKDANVVRELRIRYDGLLHKDEALAGAHVYWYVPNNTTMLRVDELDLQARGFSSDCYPTARAKSNCKTYKGPSATNYNQNSKTYQTGDTFTIYEFNSGFYSLTRNGNIGNSSPTAEWVSANDIEILRSEYYRDGYTCFYKQIGSEEVTTQEWDPELNENIEVTTTTCKEADTYFYYKIKDYYSPTFLRNMIFCHIEKNEYPFEADIQFVFSTLGTSGTDYTLMVIPSGTQTAIQGTDKNLPLLIDLYDYNNEPIDMYTKFNNNGEATKIQGSPGQAFDARVEWMGPSVYNLDLISDEATNTVTSGQALISGTTLSSTLKPESYCGIAKVITSFGLGSEGAKEDEENTDNESSNKKYRVVDLTTLYPIAWTVGEYYIEGATTIVYDSYGKNPNYYKDPYRIFKANTNDELSIGKTIGEETITDLTWSIAYFIGEDGKQPTALTEDDSIYEIYQTYKPVLNDKNGLTPCNMYIENMDVYPVVQCWITTNKAAKTLYWSQPLVIIQNRYPSAMLNAWDGSLTIDEKNGTILSTMVGAGRKTANNTFEGVLMGDIAGSAGMDLDNKTGLGIYGFHDGAQSFGMNIDGTAFFGKAGRGRILIDGNESTIQSASYTLERRDSGMKIDLDDGWIDIIGAVKSEDREYAPAGSRIHLDIKEPFFYVESLKGNRLINIGNANPFNSDKVSDGYYLKSDNYAPTDFNFKDGEAAVDGEGMLLDLNDGAIDAFNLKITSKNLYLNSNPDLTKGEPYFVIKNNNGSNLLYVGEDKDGNSEFYLKTDPFTENVTGVKLDLSAGNFRLYTEKLTIDSAPNSSGKYMNIIGNSATDKNSTFTALSVAASGAVTFNNWVLSDGVMRGQSADGSDSWTFIAPPNLDNDDMTGKTSKNKYVFAAGGPASDVDKHPFRITSTGHLFATYGSIGGWQISPTKLYASGSEASIYLSADTGSTYVIQVGAIADPDDNSGSYFTVTRAGKVTARNATIRGGIYAWSGGISGNFYVDGMLYGGSSSNPNWSITSKLGTFANLEIKDNGSLTMNGFAKIKFGDNNKYISLSGDNIYVYGNFKVGKIWITEITGYDSYETYGGTVAVKITTSLQCENFATFKTGIGVYGTSYLVGNVTFNNGGGNTWTFGKNSTVNFQGTVTGLSYDDLEDTPSIPSGVCYSGSNSSTSNYAVATKSGSYVYGYYDLTIGTVYTYCGGSSRRFKNNITDLDVDSNIIYKLQPTSFYYNSDFAGDANIEQRRYGFIAEDLDEINNNLIDYDNEGIPCRVHYNDILTLAVAEIQKLKREIDDLKSRL